MGPLSGQLNSWSVRNFTWVLTISNGIMNTAGVIQISSSIIPFTFLNQKITLLYQHALCIWNPCRLLKCQPQSRNYSWVQSKVINPYVCQMGDIFSLLAPVTMRAFSFVCVSHVGTLVSVFSEHHPNFLRNALSFQKVLLNNYIYIYIW